MKWPAHIMVVVGAGGHSAQCLRLVNLMGTDPYRYSYILEADDKLSEQQIRVPGPVYRIVRPSCVINRRIAPDSAKFAWCVLRALIILLRVRPDAIITVGPAVAVPVAIVAKLLRKKVIYLESASRTQDLSLTGRLMGRLADLYFVQWEDVLPLAPRRAIFAGRLL